MKAVIVRARRGLEPTPPIEHWPLSRKLEEYQVVVGGYVEVVRVRHEGEVCDMVVNEDGLGLALPFNVRATDLLEAYWLEKYGPPAERMPPERAFVVGNVLILHGCRL